MPLRPGSDHSVASATTTHDAATVGTSASTVVAANGRRNELFLQNDHATQVIYLSLGGTAEANKGIRLNAAGGGVVITRYSGAVSAIATGAATTLLIAEV